MARSLSVVQHEAAHVVVGVALGLRMREAVILHIPGDQVGHVWFPSGSRLACALMYAAGVAWDTRAGAPAYQSSWDAACARRELRGLGRGAYANAVAAAAGMLAGLGRAHARVTRALLERDLSGRDITALVQGERLEVE